MQIKVEVLDTAVSKKEVPYNGKTLTFFEQVCYAYLFDQAGKVDPVPTKFLLSHDKPEQALPKGVYQLLPQSVTAGKYNSLTLRPRLAPVAAAAATRAA
jgi:hypothetical protein